MLSYARLLIITRCVEKKALGVVEGRGAAGAKPMLTPAMSGYQFSSSSARENFSRRWRWYGGILSNAFWMCGVTLGSV